MNGAVANRPLPWEGALLTAAALLLYWGLGPAPEWLVYDRVAVAAGQWWRLVTGHWVHGDPAHLGWDAAALFILSWVHRRAGGRSIVPPLALGTLVVDALLWWGLPGLDAYCGLSGILNALLVGACWRAWRGEGHWIAPLVPLGALLRAVVEMAADAPLGVATLWPPLPEAHLAGLAAGALLVLLSRSAPSTAGRR